MLMVSPMTARDGWVEIRFCYGDLSCNLMTHQEELCIGPHVKFNNNCGSVNLDDPQPHLQAFSHWSYEVTDKKLMVVDVQVSCVETVPVGFR